MAKSPDIFKTAFDTYERVGVIGEGGAGRVFEVRDSQGETFALKCLRPELVSSDKLRRFKNEVNFCSRHNHPNLIHVVASGVVNWNSKDSPFYVMPKYAGTLRGLMELKVAPANVLRIFAQILQGLEAAHLLGVVHRDVKPENILYDPSAEIFVVADLGIAHFEEEMLVTAVETKASERLLNISYSAPEQRARGQVVDHRADIYALGQILNEMFTGSVPEGSGHRTIGQASPKFSYLDGLVERMRRQEPSARPQSIGEVKRELIARGAEFLSLQELDSKKKEVVHSSAPAHVQPVTIESAYWDSDVLTLTLNRAPELGWIQKFQRPQTGISYRLGIDPPRYQIRGSTVSVSAPEPSAQIAIDQFKMWSPMATKAFQEQLVEEARQKDSKERRRLQEELANAEARARVTAKLKL